MRGGEPNLSTPWSNQWSFVNSDERFLRDKNRPRDEFWFRLDEKLNVRAKVQIPYFTVQREIENSSSNTSFIDVSFKEPTDAKGNKEDIGLKKKQYWDIAWLDKDWFVKIWWAWMYQINILAQYIKDWEQTENSIFN